MSNLTYCLFFYLIDKIHTLKVVYNIAYVRDKEVAELTLSNLSSSDCVEHNIHKQTGVHKM